MLRSQLGGWACQARPLRLNDPLRNVKPESTSWKHQAHAADGACFQKEGHCIVKLANIIKRSVSVSWQVVTLQLMGRAVRPRQRQPRMG